LIWRPDSARRLAWQARGRLGVARDELVRALTGAAVFHLLAVVLAALLAGDGGRFFSERIAAHVGFQARRVSEFTASHVKNRTSAAITPV
jgi:hypothetical protein